MTRRHARAQRFHLPPGEWARQHSAQLVALGVIVVLLFACCNPPAWPTVIWQRVAHDCGTVYVSYERANSPDASRVETCFAQSYHRCTAATLYASFYTIDRGADYRFVTEPYGFTCAIGAVWNVVPPYISGIGISYCSSMRLESDGLHVLGCQSIDDVLVLGSG